MELETQAAAAAALAALHGGVSNTRVARGATSGHQLGKNAANYAPLTPLSFLERAAHVYPDRVSVIHGAQRSTWRQTYERSRRLADALAKRGLGVGDTVAARLPTIPARSEA